MRPTSSVFHALSWLYLFSLPIPLRLGAESASASQVDPYLWLEDIEGEKPLQWVREQNEATARRLTAQPGYDALYRDALGVLNSASRIPEVAPHGKFLYNLWRDAEHPRGVYRRATLEEFRQDSPKWETVLDVDALAKTENNPWAFGGTTWRWVDEHRCLIQLSPGGGDAGELREFDLDHLSFVQDGFVVPTAKSRVAWRDPDTLFIATDFGPGSMTASGYPRSVRLWRRGTPLSAAHLIHEAPADSIGVSARRLHSAEGDFDLLTENVTFWKSKFFQISGDRAEPLDIPATSSVAESFHGRLVIWLKEDWAVQGKKFLAGSVVIADPAALRGSNGAIDLIVAGTAENVVQNFDVAADAVLVAMLDNVRGRLHWFVPAGGGWQRETIAFPDNGSLKIVSTDHSTGEAWVQYESFTTPPALYRIAAGSASPEKLKSQAPTFNGDKFEVQQLWTASADGTKIPYFVIGPKGMKYDGTNPVWMFSYGGFEIALTPAYSGSYEDLHGAYGKLWLERGGAFVLANIRGGGEFGPQWHTTALKENHFKTFEDFEAVAHDLAVRKITSPAHLGIEGRSNGGLLVSATMLRHPELYGAVVCGNPLLDMQRYHRLLAGASWVAEYGDPDRPEEWNFISRYSPYQNVRPGMKLPPILFYTSTRDDRVHPGHARKMAAKMEAMGYAVDYYENTEGGHHGSVTNEQLATRLARTYAFLWQHLQGHY